MAPSQMRLTWALLPVLAAIVTVVLSPSSTLYCLPGDKCFPSEEKLQVFNATVNGRLIKSTPYGAACYSGSYDAEACKALAAQKHNVGYRLSLPAGLMYTNWEADGASGCPVPELPLDGSYPTPLPKKCSLGGMSSYVVNVTSRNDIALAVDFAAKHKLRFRIKNTGHDYKGRSSGPATFAVWTHHLTDLTYIKNFRPASCPPASMQDVISVGPGVSFDELYEFAHRNGVMTMGGWAGTVGAAGGYVLGGGIGPLGHFFGMGVDNIVQFEAITADGHLRTINKCRNADLFWALRGGGGAFAAVTQVYYKLHRPQHSAVDTESGQIVCANSAAYEGLIEAFVDLQEDLRKDGQTGIWTASSSPYVVALLFVRPFQAVQGHEENMLDRWQSLTNLEGCQTKIQSAHFPNWNAAFRAAIRPVIEAGSPIGTNALVSSRLVSLDIMKSPERLRQVKDYIINLPAASRFIWQNSVGDASAAIPRNETAIHPEWRNAFAYVDTTVFGPWSGVTPEQDGLAKNISANAIAVFGTAAYYNEASVSEKDWQKSFWGTNYARLLQIKARVDPNRVFSCRMCVGSERGF
ncbi:hypothetical protein BDV95DRAFT_609222 [Massariosphaeria phaeospora]|uniref:FAD-binding PCMH-type domain-containing protein n=1 Tax=Massariosphaeria phaeospora TaxID=100035 RepID=A0A7C8M8Q4_9PLEO|nr:hypothetical protein BDV95DRAFT_609222 [Massariosphaeria phaeospora]